MEPAKIDWPNLKSVFVIDDLYEHINAPQWIDLSSPIDPVDDESWFCTMECNHPKTAEDFLKETPNSKLKRSILPLGNLKRRGFSQSLNSPSKSERFIEDGENQNPNFSTPSKQYNSMKAKILLSNSDKKKKKQIPIEEKEEENVVHKLKSTLSARNLFTGGRNLLGPITEFCNELKRLAMRTKEKEKEKSEKVESIESPLLDQEIERKRKPLLEKKCRSMENEENNIIIEEKPRRKK
ncbi:uncharacterized protein LOC124942766 [Impatiens glandulifera]|uniref:uncharacterized protein LOC124942766 n=1 Tax=Impatiens glandulifera TaxID=253017 RepID=UPI001FB05AE8|nr:uncharacterized protein LOC124942766 [Impatiens glandulifera]